MIEEWVNKSLYISMLQYYIEVKEMNQAYIIIHSKSYY